MGTTAHSKPEANASEMELERRLWGSKHTATPALDATITRPASSVEGAVREEQGGEQQAGEGVRRTEAGAVGGEGRVAVNVTNVLHRWAYTITTAKAN